MRWNISVAHEGCYFMRFDITSPPREPIVAAADHPNDVTGAYIVPSPHCFPHSGAQRFDTHDDGCCDARNMWSSFAVNIYLHLLDFFIHIEL